MAFTNRDRVISSSTGACMVLFPLDLLQPEAQPSSLCQFGMLHDYWGNALILVTLGKVW